MDAGTLKCPACGAIVPESTRCCPYCTAALETTACPHCMQMMFVGTKFCPHCGAAATQVVAGAATDENCPRCHVALQSIQLAKVTVSQCNHCGGFWADCKTFDTICSDTEAQTAASGLNLPPRVTPDPHVHYLACPQCKSLMGRINYFGHSGIVLNVCRGHGFWLDRDQLGQIIQFIRSGGIDRSREIEKEKLEDARRRLEAENMVRDISTDYTQ